MFENYFRYVDMIKSAKTENELETVLNTASDDSTITYFEFMKLYGIAYPDV